MKSFNEYEVFTNEGVSYPVEKISEELYLKYFTDKNRNEFLKSFEYKMRIFMMNGNHNIFLENGTLYLKKELFLNQLELLENSVSMKKVVKFMKESVGYKSNDINKLMNTRYEMYTLMFINDKDKYIRKQDFETFKIQFLKVETSNCIKLEELRKEIKQALEEKNYGAGYSKDVNAVIEQENLEFYPTGTGIHNRFIRYDGNLRGYNLYPEDTVKYLKGKLKSFVSDILLKLINIEQEEYNSLTDKDLEEQFYTLEEFKDLMEINDLKIPTMHRFVGYEKFFKETNVKMIKFDYPIKQIYVSKKEVDVYVENALKYINFEQFKKIYGISDIGSRQLNSAGFKVIKEVPLLAKGLERYILKKDANEYVSKYVNKAKCANELKECKNLFEQVTIRIKYGENEKQNKLNKLMKLYFEYLLSTSNNSKKSNRDKELYDMYLLLCNEFEKDIVFFSDLELSNFFEEIMIKLHNRRRLLDTFVRFTKFVNSKEEFKGLLKYTKIDDQIEEMPYKPEEFIEFTLKLLDLASDKEIKKKLLLNFNNSSVLTYTFLHLCTAWRRMDLIKNFPDPNLNLIKFGMNEDEFIEWIENNELSEEMAIDICNDIERKTNAFRLETNKTGSELVCIIPKVLCKEIALLLCINYANRKIEKRINKSLKAEYKFKIGLLNKAEMNRIFFEEFNFDIKKTLSGGFKNRKANKSYLTLIVEKSEEFGLACGYYYAQKLRSHKSRDKNLYSNTTKIYLDKDISKTSVLAFAIGTMGSIKYNLVELVDSDFKLLSANSKGEILNKIKLNPLNIDKSYEILSVKSNFIKKTLNKALTTKEKSDKFLETLIYGNKVYGKHEHTKCLFKIIKEVDKSISGIEIQENSKCPYKTQSCIGCSYLIGLKFFIYEFEKKFNDLLKNLENAKTKIDREINIKMMNELYIPIILDMQEFFGKDKVNDMLNTKQYKKIVNSINKGE